MDRMDRMDKPAPLDGTARGFVRRDHTWSLKTGLDAKLSQYRLSDNYMRFYLKYIDKYKSKVNRGVFVTQSLSTLPGWSTIIGLQFENLVLNNRALILKKLGIRLSDIICENPYFQHKTTKQKGCQIDYLVQTKSGSLYVCEIKFTKNTIGTSIIQEVQEKIDRIKSSKGMSYRPILIHAGQVAAHVVESDYFVKIIDFSGLLIDK